MTGMEIAILVLLTFLPFVELRLAIPVGILSGTMALPFGYTVSGLGLEVLHVFFICVLANFLLGVIIYTLLTLLDSWLHNLSWAKPYIRLKERSERKLRPFTQKYGVLGVALFIGIPLPVSGVYTGAIGAFVLGLPRKQFFIASAIGVLIAGVLVTALTLAGIHFL